MRNKIPACRNIDCGIYNDPIGNLTFGSGELDCWGYWEHGCDKCARAFAETHSKYAGSCIGENVIVKKVA